MGGVRPKCRGKIARSTPRPPFGPPVVRVAARSSRLPSRELENGYYSRHFGSHLGHIGLVMSARALVPSSVRPALRAIRSAWRGSWLYELWHSAESRQLLHKAPRPLKLHLGCGDKVLLGWLNIDMRKRPGVAVMRLPKGLRRFPDQSVSFVYSAHMLEHLDYPDEALALARELRRILVPGGAVRFVVPGIERIIRAYAADDKSFFEHQREHHPASCETNLEHLMYALQQDGDHKYGYDFETAKKLLTAAGFSRVVDSEFNQSEFQELRVDYRGENLSLFVDAVV
jgi:predicted SAM-dependent methyltransferase